MERYYIDLLGLPEVRRLDHGQQQIKNKSLFPYSGKLLDQDRKAGVGIILSTKFKQ